MRILKNFWKQKADGELASQFSRVYGTSTCGVPVEEDTTTEPVYAIELLKRIRYRP